MIWNIVMTAAVAAGLILFFYFRSRAIAARQSIADRVIKTLNHGIRSATPTGATVYFEDGTAAAPALLAAIDAGIDSLLERVRRCTRYDPARTFGHGNFQIAILKAVPDSDGNPAFQEPAAQYIGTEYEHIGPDGKPDGTILVAGQCLVIDGQVIVVLPEHTSRYDHLSLVMDYEGEHQVLFTFDLAEFAATQTHSAANPHPIIHAC